MPLRRLGMVVRLASDAKGHNQCALFSDGRVLCSQEYHLTLSPFRLPPGEQLVELAVGLSHVCGIRADDTVLCVPFNCSPDCTASISPPAGFKVSPR